VSTPTQPEDDEERSRIRLGCALAAAAGVTLLLLVLFGIVYLFFVVLGHVRISAAPQNMPWLGLAPNRLFE